MNRPSLARIDLQALRHNYRTARELHGEKVLAVLKANAYGHGAVRCAAALADIADGFAVAFLSEALELREAGITAPILVLEGAFDAAELHAAASHALWIVVHQEAQLQWIEQMSNDAGALNVWLKMDSGMGRAGFAPAAMAGSYARLQACSAVGSIVLMSHFARADELDVPITAQQIATFNAACSGLDAPRSLANSAGILGWSGARQHYGRSGIMLYGADPLAAHHPKSGLQPVMALQSRVFAERWLAPGAPLGYGGGFVAERRTRVGLVAIGYADGYPRTAPTGTAVAVDGQITRLIGRVSMDMLTVDLTDLPEAGIGSEVELWGATVDVNQVAASAGTIAYELLCNVKRVPRVYAGAASPAAANS
ncbi:alanine racemase [Acidovorax sp. JG5]|uniref:alanine racemase n=1 Tax=Acidovorax sp. JG5 TaxID=2822718 RepID=UPI001B32979A|nr:alanine racemase [Acidovorax sp. JG5]MBP3981336.1 alanine racemase [Acidovorax sp. JG5]